MSKKVIEPIPKRRLQKTLRIGREKASDELRESPLDEKSSFYDPGDARFWTGLKDLKNIGRYEITKKVGQGGSGVVYLGWDPYIKRHVAIKLSRPTSEKAREIFFVEAQSAGQLNHPNIIAVYDSGVYNYHCYIAMEYVNGVTLKEYCCKDKLLPVRKVVDIISGVCLALDYAHHEGVVHKDIKPTNLLLDNDGAVKITDFGLAQIGEPARRLTKPKAKSRPLDQEARNDNDPGEIHLYGTPSYMSPEQLNNKVVGRESDIYSLGCVLFELLTGVQAFAGESLLSIAYKINTQDPPSILDYNPELPQAMETIVNTALKKDPADRFYNCADFAYNLKATLKDLEGTVKETRDFFDFVQSVTFFNSFNKEEVRKLVTASNIVQANSGKVIIPEGDRDDTFYVILSGRVKVRKGNHYIATIGPGECFGEMALIANQPRTATVEADTNCTLMKIKAAILNKSSESVQLLFYQRFAKNLVRRLSSS